MFPPERISTKDVICCPRPSETQPTMIPAEAVAMATPAMLLPPAERDSTSVLKPSRKARRLDVLCTMARARGSPSMISASTTMARKTESSAECCMMTSS